MPSFFIFDSSTMGQTLAAGQNGFVAGSGTLFTEAATAVTINGGSTSLTVMGAVATASGSAAVRTPGTIADVSIVVGDQGSITSAKTDAVELTVSLAMDMANAGLIAGATGISVQGSGDEVIAAIDNSGRVQGRSNALEFGDLIFLARVVNSGTLSATGSQSATVLANGSGTLDLANSGTIIGTFAIGSTGTLLLDNTGTISGAVRFEDTGTISNSGLIEGSISDTNTVQGAGAAGMTVRNAGTITGDVNLGNGNDTFVDLGGIVGGRVLGGNGNDTFHIRSAGIRIADSFGTNDRIFTTVDYRIGQGIEALFADTQIGLHLGGSVRGERMEGNAGNDTIEGLGGNDSLFGQNGDDYLFGGRGNDFLTGNALNDTDDNQIFGGEGDDIVNWAGAGGILNGGTGRDVLNASSLINLFADIDLQAGTASYVTIGTGAVAATVAATQFEDIGGTGNNDLLDGSNADNVIDALTGNDSLNGLGGNDTLFGGQGADTLLGVSGDDQLFGGDGTDSLSGSSGTDLLVGGLGRDTMNGGTGVDTFSFITFGESLAGTPDLITGFDTAAERIDLGAIDADLLLPGDDAFAFIGTAAFSGALAQVRYFFDAGAGQTIVQVKLAGSTVADMEIALSGSQTLADTNFFL